MLARVRHLFRRAYEVPSKLDEILSSVKRIEPPRGRVSAGRHES